jgi:glucokinase
MQKRHGHVSYERIVSGPGLVAIYEFLRDTAQATPSPALIAAMGTGDGAAMLAKFAAEGDEPIAQQALRLFVQIYGAFVGNIALATLPRGGVYVAGGIAAKIATEMGRGGFMQAFLDKGRFYNLLSTLPVFLVGNPHVGLLGASLQAQRL